MRKRSLAIYALNLALFILFFHLPALAQVSVTTQHNDLNRSGDNLSETILTKSNVNSTTSASSTRSRWTTRFTPQPLVVSGLTIGGGTHNVVYVATTSNSVYAFDADTGTQYWHVNLGTPIINAAYGTGCVDINGNAGIVGTPVIDTANNTIYVVNSLNNPSGTYSFQLHALSLTTGADNSGSPVQITATGFVATAQNQRAGLLLANGNLYVPFSSHCDMGTYHGYLMSYNPTTLAQNAVFNTSPSGNGDSLWESGQGPAVDSSGNIYFGTSNGTWDGISQLQRKLHQAELRARAGGLVHRREPRHARWRRFGPRHIRSAPHSRVDAPVHGRQIRHRLCNQQRQSGPSGRRERRANRDARETLFMGAPSTSIAP